MNSVGSVLLVSVTELAQLGSCPLWAQGLGANPLEAVWQRNHFIPSKMIPWKKTPNENGNTREERKMKLSSKPNNLDGESITIVAY